MVAGFLLGASSTGKLAGAEHLPYAAAGEPQNLRGLIDGVEVLSLHGSSITLT
jgi:hypothetical protein